VATDRQAALRGLPAERRRVYRRRRLAVAAPALALLVLLVTVIRGTDDTSERRDGAAASAPEASAAPRPSELPGGGREIFPASRVVAFYGAPQDEALGALGIGSPAQAADRLAKQAKPYARSDRPALPAFELLATVANADPGQDELYRTRQSPGLVRRYLDAARAAGALLILDIQPGRANFMSETRAFEEFLREPDVSLALDPEWHIGPGEVPGETLGSVTAADVNRVGAYLSGIVERYDLPEKLLVVHQFTFDMIEDRDELQDHPGVELTLNVDGFGGQEVKVQKYDEFTADAKRPVAKGAAERPNGFKLFYEEDVGLMTPREVLGLEPAPDFVVYE